MANIMIVDDSRFMRLMLSKIISLTKHHVVAEASNGLEAVNLYNKFKPDLVTMDITMTDMNGIDSLRCIRELDPYAKVIMCSAMGQQSYLLEALRLGAKDFIIKPFQKNRVTECIENSLQ
jgi:two-component system chemotaxis response regulator CheY